MYLGDGWWDNGRFLTIKFADMVKKFNQFATIRENLEIAWLGSSEADLTETNTLVLENIKALKDSGSSDASPWIWTCSVKVKSAVAFE